MSDGLVRWEPIRDLVTLREAMDRLFTESFVRPGVAFPSLGMEGPAVDMYQTKDDIIVKAAVPGVKPEDIDIARAQAAKERAERRLKSPDLDLDINRATVALKRALIRLQISSRHR